MSTTEPVGTLETTGAYPKYDEYEESGVEWLGEIPTHWETIRLNWAADYINGYMFSPDERGDEGLPIIRIAQLTGESSSFDRHDGSLDEKYKVEQGDLLFSWSATLDAFVWDQGPAWLNQHIFRVEPISKLDKKYLGYCLKAIIPVLVRDSHGSTMKHIKRQTLKDHSIGLPPLDEQRAIATFLDRETGRIDALIEKKERLIDLLEEKRTALISRIVTKGLDRDVEMQDSGVEWLGGIPAHWETGKVAHLFDNLDSERIPVSSSNRADMQGEYPYYGASGVIDHVDDYLFDEPLILVAEDGANLLSRSTPLAFVARGKYWVNNHAHILRPRYEPLEYWAYVLRSIVYDPWITGSAQPKLNQENLDSIELPMPPEKERLRITERLNDERLQINHLIDKVEEGIDRLKEYRTALISAAVTGQIDVCEEVPAAPVE